MRIGDVDFSYVLDHAVRCCIGSGDHDARAVMYERARQWMRDNEVIVRTWVEPPAYCDPRGLVFRRLVAHLNDISVYEPADNRTLTHVIAAGDSWDEMPTSEYYNPDDSWQVEGLYGFDRDDVSPLELISRWQTMIKVQRLQAYANGGVYLAHSTAFGMYKIGKSSNALKRVSALRTACPDLVMVCSVPFGGLALERFLHKHFEAQRRYGEWFALGSEGKNEFLAAIKIWQSACDRQQDEATER
jgi:hypothetical protein